ncbi:MAG: SCP2 sterol-binding domain-containing protein [Proteobacteria bacterium]|nr:SCP2 sterol-binding domain-containing protein [Pseudomonadota bacterium]
MAGKTLHLTLDLDEVVLEFLPKVVREFMKLSGAAAGLAGTEFSLEVNISGDKYRYIVKNGAEFDVAPGGLENPMVAVSIPMEDMQKLILMKNIDMLLGIQKKLTKEGFNVLSRIKGTVVFDLTNEDGGKSEINVRFNGAEAPKARFLMGIDQARSVISGQDNPVNLFMSGRLKIEGDMALAMSVQPLFS